MAYTFQNNISGTTAEIIEGSFGDIIKITANEGVTIKSTPQPTATYEKNDSFGGQVTVNLRVAANGKTAESDDLDDYIDQSYPIVINGESEGGTPTPSVTVVNEVADTTETHSFDGETCVITLTGTKAYKFFNLKATYTGTGGETLQADFSVDDKTATATITGADFTQPITVTGTFEKYFTVTNNLTNCSVSGLEAYYKNGDTIAVTLTANTGTAFVADNNAPRLEYYDSIIDDIVVPFTIAADGKTATLSYVIDKGNLGVSRDFYLLGGAIEKTPVSKNYGAINVYLVTDENLEALAKVRFIQAQGETGGDYIDIGTYVNRIKRLYLDVPSSGVTTLECGNYHTDITVNTPETNVIALDFGSVVIPAPNADTTDYDSNVSLFLPFKGFVNVSEEYVGKEVNLTYAVDIITGSGVARLTCDGVMFQAEEIEPSTDVIYKTTAQDIRVVGGDDWDARLLYGLVPYFYVRWYESKNKNERNSAHKRGKISDFTGFNLFDDIEPISTPEMLTSEQETIYRLLQNGVYVE